LGGVSARSEPASTPSEPARGRSEPARGELLLALRAMRARLGLVGLLLALAAAAWWMAAARMNDMSMMGTGSQLGTLGWFVVTWVVMMAAMMLPSVAPTAVLYARMTRRRGTDRGLLFTAAYLLVWGATGALAYGVFEAGRSLFGQELAWNRAGSPVAAGVVGLAALYEFTPWKNVCLARCRGPLGFILGSWRDGRLGALQMGGRHALWCLGCCWALMAALFALGIMSLGWMALVAALIALEKTLPWRRLATGGTALVLLSLAGALAAGAAA
jgi:predicted metal-binding membrane protein